MEYSKSPEIELFYPPVASRKLISQLWWVLDDGIGGWPSSYPAFAGAASGRGRTLVALPPNGKGTLFVLAFMPRFGGAGD
ncbi:Fatty Acyl-Coa Reductase 1 [Manis pentadactyla]|nr:Fatty Acyl-Coa Reductase 1 [Manis pentadactyla]